jgi:hypothetical protein
VEMPRPISTRTHGVIDYITSGTLMALPFLLGWEGRARGLALGAGIATLGTSLMTNYEYGAVKLLPMKAHLSIDAAQASALMSAPKIMNGDGRWAGRILAMIGAMESAVGAMTKTHSPEELAENPQLALDWGRS